MTTGTGFVNSVDIRWVDYSSDHAVFDRFREAECVPHCLNDTVTVESNFVLKKLSKVGVSTLHFLGKHVQENEQGEQERQTVAVKCIKNVFSFSQGAKRILRELKILRLLKNHPNVSCNLSF